MHNAVPTLQVAHAEAAQFLAAQPVVEQGGQDGAVAHALARVGDGGLEQGQGLRVAQGGRGSFVHVSARALDAIDRVPGDGVAFAQIVEQRRERRELPPARRPGQVSSFEGLAPGDDMRPGDRAEPSRAGEPGEGDEVADVGLVGAPGLSVGEVGQPRQFMMMAQLSQV